MTNENLDTTRGSSEKRRKVNLKGPHHYITGLNTKEQPFRFVACIINVAVREELLENNRITKLLFSNITSVLKEYKGSYGLYTRFE